MSESYYYTKCQIFNIMLSVIQQNVVMSSVLAPTAFLAEKSIHQEQYWIKNENGAFFSIFFQFFFLGNDPRLISSTQKECLDWRKSYKPFSLVVTDAATKS